MLGWKEIKGYDNKKCYERQVRVGLPELEEEILIQYIDRLYPDRPPFVGYFQERQGRIWMIISANYGMSLYEVQNGIKWARFNRP